MTAAGPTKLRMKGKGGVFFLFGGDEFRKEEEARALVDWHLDPGTRDFNYDPMRGSEVSVEDMASILATPPMMAEWRVVLLRGPFNSPGTTPNISTPKRAWTGLETKYTN